MTWIVKWLLVAAIVGVSFIVITSAVMWTAVIELWRELLSISDPYHRRPRR